MEEMENFEENIRRAAEKVHRLNGVGASKEEIKAAVGALLELQGDTDTKDTSENTRKDSSPIPTMPVFGLGVTSPGSHGVESSLGMSQKEYEASIEKEIGDQPSH